ncbi:MAG: rhomboid family intramembrane serine protease [Planctomycetota bacterium]
MGISDRDYMSERGGSFGTIRGYDITAVVLLLLINILVWLVWQFASQSEPLESLMKTHFMTTPWNVLNLYHVHTLLTSSISHQDTYHLLFNMLFFWFLGRDVEVFYGRNNFIALYIFAALASSVAQCGIQYQQHTMALPALGASGAVMGVAAVAAFIDPHKKLYIWGILPIKLWMLVPAYVLMDFSGMMNEKGSGIAHAAHLGGAFAGVIFYALDLRVFSSRGRQRSGLLFRVRQWWLSRSFRVVERPRNEAWSTRNEEPVATRKERPPLRTVERVSAPPPVTKSIDTETAQRVDQLLAKISREGIGSLSDDERAFLKNSSEKYKR